MTTWFVQRHRRKKGTPAAEKPLLDLAGKHSRKKPPLQKWQAFSSIYYRPPGSLLRAEVKSLYDGRHNPAAVEHLGEFFPPDADIASVDFLTFLGAFSSERCTRLSDEEEKEVQEYIESQQLLAAEQRDCPWHLDDDYEDKPILAENRYIQQ